MNDGAKWRRLLLDTPRATSVFVVPAGNFELTNKATWIIRCRRSSYLVADLNRMWQWIVYHIRKKGKPCDFTESRSHTHNGVAVFL